MAMFHMTNRLLRIDARARLDDRVYCCPSSLFSEFEMETRHADECGTAVAVVTRVGDERAAARSEDAPPYVRGVVALHDRLAAVTERAVAEQEAEASQPEALTMLRGEPVGHERDTAPVGAPVPPCAGEVAADRRGVVHFRVRERLRVAAVPTGSTEQPDAAAERILRIRPDAILD